jgi:hypothetical protein
MADRVYGRSLLESWGHPVTAMIPGQSGACLRIQPLLARRTTNAGAAKFEDTCGYLKSLRPTLLPHCACFFQSMFELQHTPNVPISTMSF